MTDKYECDLCGNDELKYHEVKDLNRKENKHICNKCISDLSDAIFDEIEYRIEDIIESKVDERFSEEEWHETVDKKLGLTDKQE